MNDVMAKDAIMGRWLVGTGRSRDGFWNLPMHVIVVGLFVLQSTTCLAVELSFYEFQQINQQNYDQVQSGNIQVHCNTYERKRLEDLQRRAAVEKEHYDRKRQEIETSDTMSEARQAAMLEQLEERRSQTESDIDMDNLETWSEETRTYTFDLGTNQCRIDTQCLTPGANDQSCIIVRSEGTQIQYFTKYDYGIVNHMKNPRVTRKMPCQFGTVTPKWFAGMSEDNVTTTTEVLDGHEVIVYDIVVQDQFRTRLYVDPTLGYRYRKMEIFRDGHLIRSYRAQEYELFDGIPVPTVHEAASYEIGSESKPITTEKMNIRTAQLNHEIDPRAFRIGYTSKSKILDMTLGMLYQPFMDVDATDLAPQSVEDVVATILDIKANTEIESAPKDNAKIVAQVTIEPGLAPEPQRKEAAAPGQSLADSTAPSVDEPGMGYKTILLVVAFLGVAILCVKFSLRKAQL